MIAQQIAQQIVAGGCLLAFVVRADRRPASTTFLTEPEASFQVGLAVLPPQGVSTRHRHLPIVREIVGTSEALLVREGACEVDVYDVDDQLAETVPLSRGDVVVFTGEGAHEVRSSEGAVLLELKQGPFGGAGDSERF